MYYVNWKILNAAMKKKHMTDQMLADKLGVLRPTIVAWRYRDTGPSRGDPALLDKLCNLLDIDKEKILVQPPVTPKKLYEELLEGMLSIVKLDNIIDGNDEVFNEILGKDYKKLCSSMKLVRKLTAKVYIGLEQEDNK